MVRRFWIALALPLGCGAATGGPDPMLPSAPVIDECGVGEMPLVGGGCQRVGLPAECWSGWTPTADGACEPVLPEEPCEGATMPVIGESTCQTIQDCGTGTWGDIERDPGAIHVDASYAGGGSNGTAAQPFVALAEAINQAQPGGQVVIAAGEYPGGVIVNKTLRIEGRCPELVVVQASDFGFGVIGQDVSIRGVTVTGGGIGFQLEGIETLVENVLVRDLEGPGVLVQFGGTADLRRVSISGAAGAGVAVYSSEITLEECTIDDIASTGGGTTGFGVVVATQAPGSFPGDLRMSRSIVQRTQSSGIGVIESIAVLDEVVVRNVDPQPLDGARGMGLYVANDVYSGKPSDAQVRRSLIANTHHAGVLVEGSTALIEATQIRDTESVVLSFARSGGFGIWAFEEPLNHLSSAVTVRQSLLSGNRHAGAWISGSTATIEETWIRDTRSEESSQGWGVGLLAAQNRSWRSADVGVIRSLFSGNRQAGMLIAASNATLEDVVVEDTATIERGATGGRGIALQGSVLSATPATAEVTRALVRGSLEAGISACGATVSLQDVVVSDVSANLDGRFGDGIAVGGCGLPTTVDVVNAWVQGAERAGASFFGASGSLAATITEAGVAVTLESGATPTIAAGNVYAGNDVDEVVEDSGLEPLPALPVTSQ